MMPKVAKYPTPEIATFGKTKLPRAGWICLTASSTEVRSTMLKVQTPACWRRNIASSMPGYPFPVVMSH